MEHHNAKDFFKNEHHSVKDFLEWLLEFNDPQNDKRKAGTFDGDMTKETWEKIKNAKTNEELEKLGCKLYKLTVDDVVEINYEALLAIADLLGMSDLYLKGNNKSSKAKDGDKNENSK